MSKLSKWINLFRLKAKQVIKNEKTYFLVLVYLPGSGVGDEKSENFLWGGLKGCGSEKNKMKQHQCEVSFFESHPLVHRTTRPVIAVSLPTFSWSPRFQWDYSNYSGLAVRAWRHEQSGIRWRPDELTMMLLLWYRPWLHLHDDKQWGARGKEEGARANLWMAYHIPLFMFRGSRSSFFQYVVANITKCFVSL